MVEEGERAGDVEVSSYATNATFPSDIIFPYIEPLAPPRKRKPSYHSKTETPITPWRLPPPTPFFDRLSPLLPHRDHSPDIAQTASQPSSFSLSSQERESTSSFSSAHSSSHGPAFGRSSSPPPPLPPPKEGKWHYSPLTEFPRRGSLAPENGRRGSDAPERARRRSMAQEELRRGSLASLDTKALPPTPGVRVAEQQQLKSTAEEYHLLEQLFHHVFESRFINMQPTRLLPNLLNIYFTRATASAYFSRYMPPPRQVRREASRRMTLRASDESAVAQSGVSLPLHHRPSVSSIGPQDENSEESGGGLARLEMPSNLVNTQLTVAIHLHRALKGGCRMLLRREVMTNLGLHFRHIGL